MLQVENLAFADVIFILGKCSKLKFSPEAKHMV